MRSKNNLDYKVHGTMYTIEITIIIFDQTIRQI